MSPAARLPVVLLWHMHQPQYRDALSGEYVLPWTYLHAIKDYIDMAAHLEAQPNARAVVNFTPVLIEQLQELAQRIDAHVKQRRAPAGSRCCACSGPIRSRAAPQERLDLLKACLRAQRKHLIERYGPFLELATIAETLATVERIPYASDQLIHDLAVWYHLAWMGETVRRSDARIAALTAQGRGFTAAQRARAAGAHRRARRRRGAALSPAGRERARRAVRDALRASDHSACCWISRPRAKPCRAWSCRVTPVIRVAPSAPSGT